MDPNERTKYVQKQVYKTLNKHKLLDDGTSPGSMGVANGFTY
jgi:hypothetical protein